MSSDLLPPGVLFEALLSATTVGLFLSLLSGGFLGPWGLWPVPVSFAIGVVHLVSRSVEALPTVADEPSEAESARGRSA